MLDYTRIMNKNVKLNETDMCGSYVNWVFQLQPVLGLTFPSGVFDAAQVVDGFSVHIEILKKA